MTLPPGYRQPHNADLWLFLGERQVAYITPLDNGRFRAGINLHAPQFRFQFFQRQDRAIAYVEAWARKWDWQIRGG
jgi:hypothetical protein